MDGGDPGRHAPVVETIERMGVDAGREMMFTLVGRVGADRVPRLTMYGHWQCLTV